MEGLEIEILQKSEVLFDNEIFRIDSEFQLKLYIDAINQVKKKPYSVFDNYIELLTDGKHGGVTLTESGVVFLRTTNIQENKINLNDLRHISEKESDETKRAEFHEGDLLLTTIGTIGLCVRVPKGFPRATINQNLVRIVLKNKDLSSIICCFLNSKYGRFQTIRFSAGNVYQMINYPNLKKVLIPNFTSGFSKLIEKIYDESETKSIQSKETYTQAETFLLQETGLLNFDVNTDPINIKSFQSSFGSTKRLDAEYYLKKYEQIVAKIKLQRHDILNNIVEISKSIEPGSNHYSDEEGLPFYRVSDYNKFGLSKPDKELTNSFVADNKDLIEKLKPKKRNNTF